VFNEEFHRFPVMVLDVSESILMMLFSKGFTEPLRGWVKCFKHNTLQDAIWRTRNLEWEASKIKFIPRPLVSQKGKYLRIVDKGKGKLDEATRRELRRKQLCYTCKEPWEPRHRCMWKGKIHYIEVISDREDEDDVVYIQKIGVT
jgi:hypothetical protein